MYNFPFYSVHPSPRWVRSYFNGELIADSREMVLFFQRPYPNYLFPKRHVAMQYLHKSEHTESRDGRGRTEYWHLDVRGKRVDNAAFSFSDHARDYLTFKWDVMDRWLEEDEEIFVHARNPYHRVDAVPSSRRIDVHLDGVKLASSAAPMLLFETGLPTRYYLPRADVNMALLEPTGTVTRCPYKGIAQTFGIRINDEFHADFAWAYAAPIAECANIQNLICFYNEVVDTSEDGTLLARPLTHFK